MHSLHTFTVRIRRRLSSSEAVCWDFSESLLSLHSVRLTDSFSHRTAVALLPTSPPQRRASQRNDGSI